MKKRERVMVFGVFDGLHEGHRAFFKEARQYGDYLIAVVTQDHIVEHLKGRLPKVNLAERFEALKREDSVDEVVIGDAKLGTWEIVKKYKPDVIALGYDQRALREDLESRRKDFDWPLEVKAMSAHEPAKYHSSIVNKSSIKKGPPRS